MDAADDATSVAPGPSRARPRRRSSPRWSKEFWWETTYVAKNLWREELLPAKYSLECVLKLNLLRQMLEWRIALDHAWTYRPGVLGKGLKAHLTLEYWIELEQTYAGAEMKENWRALSQTITLFRTVATEVARQLALEHPQRLDTEMTRYLEGMRTGASSDGGAPRA